jgi:hypothetical protein
LGPHPLPALDGGGRGGLSGGEEEGSHPGTAARPDGEEPGRRYHAAIGWLRSLPWWRIARVLFALYLVGALVSVWLPGDWRQADVALYRTDALGFWGHLGHPVLPAQYPPLSVIPFALAAIGPPVVGQDCFALGMAALFVLGFVAVRRWKGPSRAWTYAAYLLAAGPATLLFRFDLVPALLVLACLWLLERRRFAGAYPLIAVGTLFKLFPLALLPITVIADARASWSDGPRRVALRLGVGAAVCLGLVAAGFALAYAMDPAHGLGAITFNLRRPIEVEAVPATLMWLGSLAGVPIHPAYSYISYNLTGPLSGAASALGDACLVAGMLWVWWRQATGRMDTAHAFTGALLVLLCTSGVLSTQYLLWVGPILAVVDGFQYRWAAVFLLTALIFPVLFQVAVQYSPTIVYSWAFMAGIAARNLALVGCTIRFLTTRRSVAAPETAQPEAASTLAAAG